MPASEDGQSCASVITPDTGPLRWWTYMHEGSGCQGGGRKGGKEDSYCFDTTVVLHRPILSF